MGRICFSLKKTTPSYCRFLADVRPDDAIEVRLDENEFSEEEIRDIFTFERKSQLIATCHISLPSQVEEASRMLTTAILSGTDYVDIPVDFPENSRTWLMNLALNHGTRVILSWHNYSNTDSPERLLAISEQARTAGADIIKVVTTALTPADADTVLSLYDHFPPEKLLAFAMGEAGRESRFRAFEKGAPFLFVAPTQQSATAPGQPCWFDLLPDSAIKLRGEVELPASKSFAQRAILLAALAHGTTKLYKVSLCDDVSAAIGVARSLYADVTLEGTTLTIEGHQDILHDGLKVRDNTLFVGESGLLTRLCIPLAGLSREDIRIEGEKTLLKRKVDDHRAALRKLGLRLNFTNRSYLPVVVKGHLHPGSVEVSGQKGSQMISGMLLALSQCDDESTILIEDVTSEPYINLTTYIASFFGLTGYDCPELRGERPEPDPNDPISVMLDELDKELDENDEEQEDSLYRTWYIEPNQRITPVQGLEVERDWSAAAMMLVAGAVAGEITLRHLDPFSTQSDAVIIDLLKHSHVDMDLSKDNRTITVRRSLLQPFFFDITDAPDLFAPLFVLATFAEGESVIVGTERLKNKESNRAASFVEEFRKLGVQTAVSNDQMIIYGHHNHRLFGASCSSHGDHRLAMALMIASLFAESPVQIDDTACVAKSFPEFLDQFQKIKR